VVALLDVVIESIVETRSIVVAGNTRNILLNVIIFSIHFLFSIYKNISYNDTSKKSPKLIDNYLKLW
jgi:hypothetical protein